MLERPAGVSFRLKLEGHVDRTAEMRHQPFHNGDLGTIDMALPARALHGERAELIGIGHFQNAGHRVAQVHRRQEFPVERRLVDPLFVEDAIVPGDFAGPLHQPVGNARVEAHVLIEVSDLVRRRYADGNEIEMGHVTAVEDLERGAHSAHQMRDGRERTRPKPGIEPGGIDIVDRCKEFVFHCTPPPRVLAVPPDPQPCASYMGPDRRQSWISRRASGFSAAQASPDLMRTPAEFVGSADRRCGAATLVGNAAGSPVLVTPAGKRPRSVAIG